MEDFVPFEIAKKLKEKGFTCKYPFATYFRNRMYYDYDDFIGDKDAIIAPTISQVLKWLDDEKKIFLTVDIEPMGFFFIINYDILTNDNGEYEFNIYNSTNTYPSSIESVIAGIEYVLNNLI